MNAPLLYSAAALLLMLPLCGGCGDAVMTVTQPVELFVSDAVSGEPVAGASVDIPPGRIPNTLAKDQFAFDRLSYRATRSDARGLAGILLDVTWVAGGLNADLDFDRDRVTGQTLPVRVCGNDADEALKVVMVPKRTTSGDRFDITVRAIGPPTRRDYDWLESYQNRSKPSSACVVPDRS